MKVVYKYPLHLAEFQQIQLPAFAQILDIQRQGNQYCLWALVDPNKLPVSHDVVIVGTGNPTERNLDGSLFRRTTQEGAMVWHWFVRLTPHGSRG